MGKIAFTLLIAFGAFIALAMYVPHVWDVSFVAWGRAIPWIAIGVVVVGFAGYKALK